MPQSTKHNHEADEDYLQQISRLRIVVGYLGEKDQYGWWPSEFFSTNSTAFLSPVFIKTANLARYSGVKEAELSLCAHEAYWLHRITCLDAWLVLFVCGLNHVEPFNNLLVNNGVAKEILVTDWCA